MKRVLKLFLSLVLVILLAGCVKYDVTMGIKDDKSVDFEIIYAMDTKAMESMASEMESDEEEEDATHNIEDAEEEVADGVEADDYSFLVEKGYKVEEFTDETEEHKYQGVKISKTFKSIDDITKEVDKTIDFNKMFNSKEDFDDSQFFSKSGNTYKAAFLFDFTDDGKDVSAEYKDYQSMFELKFSLSLPNKAISNNATTVSNDGKSLTWDMVYGKKNEVDFSFELANTAVKDTTTVGEKKDVAKEETTSSKDASSTNKDGVNTILYLCIGAVVVAIAIVVGVSISSKKSDQKETSEKKETETVKKEETKKAEESEEKEEVETEENEEKEE